MLKFWAYAIATLGTGFGIWCIVEKRNWKWGSWFIIISLGIFFGGNLNIGTIVSVTNSFNKKIEGINEKIGSLDLRVAQVLKLEQKITQNVTLVTEVKKEITNIQEVIGQMYQNSKTEIFHEKDLDLRVKVFEVPDKGSVLYFQLENVPIANSVSLSHYGGTAAVATFGNLYNIIGYQTMNKPNTILKEEDDFYCITYFVDSTYTEELRTLKNMVYTGTEDNIMSATFNKIDKKEIVEGE